MRLNEGWNNLSKQTDTCRNAFAEVEYIGVWVLSLQYTVNIWNDEKAKAGSLWLCAGEGWWSDNLRHFGVTTDGQSISKEGFGLFSTSTDWNWRQRKGYSAPSFSKADGPDFFASLSWFHVPWPLYILSSSITPTLQFRVSFPPEKT